MDSSTTVNTISMMVATVVNYPVPVVLLVSLLLLLLL